MMSIAVGYDVRYMTDQVAAGRENYYTSASAADEPAGRWSGAGAELLGLSGDVDAELMTAIYHHLCDPTDPRSREEATWGQCATLGEPHRRYRGADDIYAELLATNPDAGPERRAELRAQAEQSARQPVAFLDATFSAPKSVSVYAVACERAAAEAHRAGDHEAGTRWAAKAALVEDAVRAGSDAMLAHLQDRAGLARVGHHGGGAGRWVDAHQWVTASFLQHDSRDHDPQLHVHNAILNRQMCDDGQWRSLDSKAIHRERAAAGALGERVMEAHLAEAGLRLEWRPDGKSREIMGVSRELCDRFSSRRRAVTDRADELLREFADRYGRDASPAERGKIMQQATLGTRAAKSHSAETVGERLDRWQAEAEADTEAGLAAVLRGVATTEPAEGLRAWSPRDVTFRGIALAAERKASWTRSDLTRAISDSLPAELGLPPERVGQLLESLTDHALKSAVRLTHHESTDGLHAGLVRADGSSVYDSGQIFYAAEWQLAAEKQLAEHSVARGAEAFTADEVQQVLERAKVGGRALGDDQARAVAGVLGGGSLVDVIKAPAGTGKSYVVGILAEVWSDQAIAPHPTGRRTFGLAVSQNAADVLAAEGLTHTANIADWSSTQARLDDARRDADEHWRLRADDLVVVDEAGMVDTAQLAQIAERCRNVGAKLVLTGDPRQLGAVGAGGALEHLFGASPTHELVAVRRFTHGWEGPASLRLRDGDTTVIAEYATHGRLVDGGPIEMAERAAGRAWLADHLDGKDTVLLVGSNESAARVNARLRTELIRLGRVSEDGVALGFAGEVAGVGDLISARRNGRSLDYASGSTLPVNRDRYRVVDVEPDGSLRVARVIGHADGAEQLDEPTTLTARYVAEHVSLGYAATVHSVQGRTVDTSHVVLGAGSDPGGVYVGLSRGRLSNTAYAITQPAQDDLPSGAVHDTKPRTAEAVLADAMARPSRGVGDLTASATDDDDTETASGVHTHLDRLSLELSEATAGRTSTALDRLVAEGRLTHADRLALAADPKSMGLVDRLLRGHELAGGDRDQLLTDAVTKRGFGDAMSPGSVLYSRLQGVDLQPQLSAYTDLIPPGLDEQTEQRLTGLAQSADDRRRELATRTSAEPPGWAVAALGPVPDEPMAAYDWERKAGWAAAYRELTGWTDEQAPLGPDPGAMRTEQRAAWRMAHTELNLPDSRAEEAEMSEAQHRARIAGWEAEQRWAPVHVDDAATATALDATRAEQDATIWAANTTDPVDDLADAAKEAKSRGARGWETHEQLQAAREARAVWLAETAVTRDHAERSRAHLAACGVDVGSPDDRVTADEWLDAHQHDQRVEERVRPVTETDVDEVAEPDALPTPAEGVLETVTDETPERHASEDIGLPREVPDADTLAEIAERARAAEREVAARAAAEAERVEMERVWHDADQYTTDDDDDVLIDVG